MEPRKLTQKEKVLEALRKANGEKVSGRYFKQQLFISEVNGRISELRNAGYKITGAEEEGHDEFGFAYHRGCVNNEQATRTAWRIIFEWVRAQLALVEVNMVTVPQVFLPYAIMKDGRTLSEHVASDPSFLLGDGKQS